MWYRGKQIFLQLKKSGVVAKFTPLSSTEERLPNMFPNSLAWYARPFKNQMQPDFSAISLFFSHTNFFLQPNKLWSANQSLYAETSIFFFRHSHSSSMPGQWHPTWHFLKSFQMALMSTVGWEALVYLTLTSDPTSSLMPAQATLGCQVCLSPWSPLYLHFILVLWHVIMNCFVISYYHLILFLFNT